MGEAFIGRERELAVLREFADSDAAELFVLFGRRRVGKNLQEPNLGLDR